MSYRPTRFNAVVGLDLLTVIPQRLLRGLARTELLVKRLAAVAKPALTGSAHIANPPPTPVPASASPL